MKSLLKHATIKTYLSSFAVLVTFSIGSFLLYTGMHFNQLPSTTIQLTPAIIEKALALPLYSEKIKTLGIMLFAADPKLIDKETENKYLNALQQLASQAQKMNPAEQDLFDDLLKLTQFKIVYPDNEATFNKIVQNFLENSLRKGQ